MSNPNSNEQLLNEFIEANGKPEVELVGYDGNAFAILGRTIAALKKAGATKEVTDAFRSEATSSDYNYLLQTAMKYLEVS